MNKFIIATIETLKRDVDKEKKIWKYIICQATQLEKNMFCWSYSKQLTKT